MNQLFYLPDITESSSLVTFDKEESRHVVKVLRKKEGDSLSLTNGKGVLFKATIVNTDLKKCQVEIQSIIDKEPLPYYLHLAVAPTKLNDRFEWFLEKATEIGISEITPILCDNSERRVIKIDRYNKILQSAMKQSLRTHLPILNPLVSLNNFLIDNQFEGIKCIAHCEDGDKELLSQLIKPKQAATILIGPEGDFSSDEVTQAIKSGYTAVSLGNSRLRTETAAITACHSVAFINLI